MGAGGEKSRSKKLGGGAWEGKAQKGDGLHSESYQPCVPPLQVQGGIMGAQIPPSPPILVLALSSPAISVSSRE